ncbi:MAG: SIMPL domain-containing protein [Anaerolineae bacterium]|nr:SIMPL domain-containing protein [Gemmatimonadaceae bacterium]
MHRVMALSIFLGLAAPPSPHAQAASVIAGPDPRVEVTGHGESRVSPDGVNVTFSVETKGSTAAAAAGGNARVQERVVDTLRALGFTEKQISTISYNVAPNYEASPDGRGRSQRGYIARNAVRVELTQLDRIGAVIDAALARGATGVSNVQFKASNTAEARAIALQQAAGRARAEALVLAKAFGGTLGPLLEVTTLVPDHVAGARLMSHEAYSSVEGTPISPSEIVVAVSIVARWRFVSGQ